MSYYIYMFEKKENDTNIPDIPDIPDLFLDSRFNFKGISFEVKNRMVIIKCNSSYNIPIGYGDYKYFRIEREYIFPFKEGDAIEVEIYDRYSHIQGEYFHIVNVTLVKKCHYYRKVGIDRIENVNPNRIYSFEYIHKTMDFFLKTDGIMEVSSKSTGEKYQYDYEYRDSHVFYTYNITNSSWVVEEVQISDPPHLRKNERVLYTLRKDVYSVVKEILNS